MAINTCKSWDANPGVAGPGVVLSMAISSGLTILILTLCRLPLVLIFCSKHVEEQKPNKTSHGCIWDHTVYYFLWIIYSLVYVVFWLLKKLMFVYDICKKKIAPLMHWFGKRIRRNEKTEVKSGRERLDKFLFGLSMQQIVTGLALCTTTTVSFHGGASKDPHVDLATKLCCQTLLTGLVSLFGLQKTPMGNPLGHWMRQIFCIIGLGWALALRIAFIVYASSGITDKYGTMVPYFPVLLVASGVFILDRSVAARSEKWQGRFRGSWFTTTTSVLLLYSYAMCIFALFDSLNRRYGHPNDACWLNTDWENKWDFGQILPMVLLLAPAFAFVDIIGESPADNNASLPTARGDVARAIMGQNDDIQDVNGMEMQDQPNNQLRAHKDVSPSHTSGESE